MLCFNQQQIIPSATVMNANFNSAPQALENMWGYCIQIFWSGTPNGAFKLQSSNDPVPKQLQQFGTNGAASVSVANWIDIPNTSTNVSANNGSIRFHQSGLEAYNWVRVVYTDASSGSATSTIGIASFNAKGA